MENFSELGRMIAAAARTMNHRPTLDQVLQNIVDVARDSVPGFDHVGISTCHRDGRIETRAATSELVRRLDQVQYDLGEGPCLDSLRDCDMVSAPDIRHDQRWARYVPEAVAEGVLSQMAVKLYLDDEGTLGTINFYSTTSKDVDEDAPALADLFAAHSAIALGHAHERHNLNEAMQSRKVIGQAIGIIMERYEMNEDRAFSFLLRASSHTNVKLRNVAQEIVDHANTRQPQANGSRAGAGGDRPGVLPA